MNIVVLKVIATSATFVIAVLGIWASYKLRRFTKFFDIASAFSAGIILATAYTHMLPEAMHEYEHFLYDSHDAETAVTPTVSAASVPATAATVVPGSVTGDATMTVAPAFVGHVPPPVKNKRPCKHKHHKHGAHGHDHDHDHGHDDAAPATGNASGAVPVSANQIPGEEDDTHSEPYPLIPLLAAVSFLCLFLVERGAIMYMKNKKNHTRAEEVKVAHECEDGSGVTCGDSHHSHHSNPHNDGHSHDHHDHAHASHDNHNHASSAIDCCKDIKSLEKMSEVTAFALILAVSLHAVMEGMGMGSRNTTSQVLSAFIGVATHKGLEGFAVGANLVESAVSTKRFIMYAGVVCLASPIGALIGYLLTLGNASVGVAGPILGALAVGTFLQVATMEFLPRAFAKPENFWLKAMALLAGFGIMSVFPLFVPHEH
jgi:zinc transporter ZupT